MEPAVERLIARYFRRGLHVHRNGSASPELEGAVAFHRDNMRALRTCKRRGQTKDIMHCEIETIRSEVEKSKVHIAEAAWEFHATERDRATWGDITFLERLACE